MESNEGPSAYEPNAFLLGPTSSLFWVLKRGSRQYLTAEFNKNTNTYCQVYRPAVAASVHGLIPFQLFCSMIEPCAQCSSTRSLATNQATV